MEYNKPYNNKDQRRNTRPRTHLQQETFFGQIRTSFSWYQGTKKTDQKPESSLNSTRSGELQETLRSISSRPWLNLLKITRLLYNHLWWPEHSIHQIQSLIPARSNTWEPIPKQWSIFLLPIHFRLWGSAWLTDFFPLSQLCYIGCFFEFTQVTSIIALDVTPTPILSWALFIATQSLYHMEASDS